MPFIPARVGKRLRQPHCFAHVTSVMFAIRISQQAACLLLEERERGVREAFGRHGRATGIECKKAWSVGSCLDRIILCGWDASGCRVCRRWGRATAHAHWIPHHATRVVDS